MAKKLKVKSQYKPKNYFALPHALLDHPDFLKMNWSSQCLLIHMCRLYNGFNNGDISIALSDMKNKNWSKGTLERSKRDLLDNGWIVVTRQGGRNHKCSLYALTWIPINDPKGKFDINVKNINLRDLNKYEEYLVTL